MWRGPKVIIQNKNWCKCKCWIASIERLGVNMSSGQQNHLQTKNLPQSVFMWFQSQEAQILNLAPRIQPRFSPLMKFVPTNSWNWDDSPGAKLNQQNSATSLIFFLVDTQTCDGWPIKLLEQTFSVVYWSQRKNGIGLTKKWKHAHEALWQGYGFSSQSINVDMHYST